MNLPYMRRWTLCADTLPERLLDAQPRPLAFRLPGADALAEFADLISGSAPETADTPIDERVSAPFALPALLPEDVSGPVALECEIDFGAHTGDRAALLFDSVCGSGKVMLTHCPRPGEIADADECIASFKSGPLTLDLTSALVRRRRCRIALRFDDARPAGVPGTVFLRITAHAAMGDVFIRPNSVLHTLTLKTSVTAVRAGDYILRAQLCPFKAPACEEEVPPIREMSLSLTAGESKPVQLAMEAHLPAFVPAVPYEAPALKAELFLKLPSGKIGPLCDTRLLLCGFPGPAPDSFLPLGQKDLQTDPRALAERLASMHITAVSLTAPAPDPFCLAMTRAGVAVRQTMDLPDEERTRLLRWPCITLDEAFTHRSVDNYDAALSAWQLGGLVTYPRTPDPDMTPGDMLRDAAGHAVDAEEDNVQAVLAWLRAVSVRLRAEAIRQGQLSGAYCAPGEWNTPDIAEAIRTALSPLHLSVLPLCGAWWTCSRFSASVRAFLPKGRFASNEPLRAEILLEDAQGDALASVVFPCPPDGGNLGLIEATLPEHTCVLELTVRLYNGKKILEEYTLPVYVGERGVLEAAL